MPSRRAYCPYQWVPLLPAERRLFIAKYEGSSGALWVRASLTLGQDYGGISSSRLEVLEERLKDDVIAEISAFDERVLLHSETSEGGVVPIWEDATGNDVAVLREVFDSKKDINGVRLHYSRVPITSEIPPDFTE